MKQIRNFGDERQTAFCCYCGSNTGTRDHVPSKIFLDKPYPGNLPVVGCCQDCNQSFSLDEEYVACLVECARLGVTKTTSLEREKIRRIIERKPALRSRLEQARVVDDKGVSFLIESDRVRNVLSKLTRGHAIFELNEPRLEDPEICVFGPFSELTELERQYFERPPTPNIWPEVGSRAMQRMIISSNEAVVVHWIIVQEGRYRYLVSVGEQVNVRVVLSEFLWCEAIW